MISIFKKSPFTAVQTVAEGKGSMEAHGSVQGDTEQWAWGWRAGAWLGIHVAARAGACGVMPAFLPSPAGWPVRPEGSLGHACGFRSNIGCPAYQTGLR